MVNGICKAINFKNAQFFEETGVALITGMQFESQFFLEKVNHALEFPWIFFGK